MKKVFSVLLAGVLLFGVLTGVPFSASAETEGDFEYEVNWDGESVMLVDYTGEGGDVVIPSTLGGLPVTKIGWNAFGGCEGLASIEIPDSVTAIWGSAFYGCSSLTSIEIPDSVTEIGDWAFYGCAGLTSIEIPASVTEIDSGAFAGCAGLTSLTVAAGNKTYTSSGNCLIEKETGVLIAGFANSEFPASVKAIGASAFYGCTGLTSIKIPDSVESIEWGAFYGCTGLESVTLPKGLTTIKYSVFHDCTALKSIEIPASVTEIWGDAFYGCSALKSVEIPAGVEEINESSFAYCDSLTSLTVADGNKTFYAESNCVFSKEDDTLLFGCAGSVIPDGVTTIGDYAFAGCTGLKSLEIPASVTEIGWAAFYRCGDLTSISVAEGNPNYVVTDGCLIEKETGALLRGTGKRVSVPDSVTTLEYGAFSGSSSLKALEIPESVESIGGCVFDYCEKLTDIYCLAQEEPEEWGGWWLEGCKAEVHWGMAMPALAIGDLGGDGEVDATDYMLLKRAVLETYTLTEEQKMAADINDDGVIDATDYMLLKRAVLGTFVIG